MKKVEKIEQAKRIHLEKPCAATRNLLRSDDTYTDMSRTCAQVVHALHVCACVTFIDGCAPKNNAIFCSAICSCCMRSRNAAMKTQARAFRWTSFEEGARLWSSFYLHFTCSANLSCAALQPTGSLPRLPRCTASKSEWCREYEPFRRLALWNRANRIHFNPGQFVANRYAEGDMEGERGRG